MALAPGTRVGAYEIVAPLGAGGMGEVYRARDSRLGRAVALKTLPPEFAADPDRRARFEREAKTLATLNHPHIAQIYGLEEVAGEPPTLALAMELVEGEDLATRIARGPLPLDEVWPLARQIAEGLEAAHEAGIVHRDLKPANIRVTADGVAKVLDFGLAKPLNAGAGPGSDAGAGATHSPTIMTSPAMTLQGVILGTAPYMAPEQAKGRVVDRRADIWAFGCVLYELLTGRRAFDGDDVPEILGAILKTEPDWAKLPAATPPRIRTLLQRCLAKDRAQRLQHIGDARLELTTPWENTAAPGAPSRAWRLGWVVAGVATAAAVVLAALLLREKPAAMPRIARFHVPLADGQQFTNVGRHVLALSPDGATLVFIANTRLYRRDLATDEIAVIQGSESRAGVLEPVFSPDGEWVAYYSADDGAIKRIRVDGGGAQIICEAKPPFGMSWGEAGLLFGDGLSGILRVNPEGGRPEVVVAVAPPAIAASPHAMPGGEWVAFSLAEGSGVDRWERGVIAMQSLITGERRTLVSSASDSRVAGGHLLYRSRGTLYAAALEVDATLATPTAVAEGLRGPSAPDVGPPSGQYAATATGLVFIRGGAAVTGARHLAVVDGAGTVHYLDGQPATYSAPRVSSDGRFVAVEAGTERETAIWIHELAGNPRPRRLTFDGENRFPIWSADGLWMYFSSARGDARGLFRQRADGSAAAQLVAPIPGFGIAEAAHPDGSLVLFSYRATDPWKLGTFDTRDRTIRYFDRITSSAPLQASLSPDGRWLAYVVTGGGAATTYVEPFPPTGAKYEVPHRAEAAHPVWLPTGRALMFQDYADLWQVDVETTPSFRFGSARPVQRGGAVTGTAASRRNLDVIPGTDSFVGVVPPPGEVIPPIATERQIDVVLNWTSALTPTPGR